MKTTTVPEYTDTLSTNGKEAINSFITFMQTEFPQISPVISYGMPMWKLGKKMYNGYVAVSAAKEHYSVHFYEESRISDLSKLLPHCTFGKRCINIKYGDEETSEIVKNSVKDYLIKN